MFSKNVVPSLAGSETTGDANEIKITIKFTLRSKRMNSQRGAVFQGELKQAMTAVQFQLGGDVGAMRFDRARADE